MVRPHLVLPILAGALTVLPGGTGVAQTRAPAAALEPIALHAGFLRTSFSGVNESDAQAAFRVFATRMGEIRGYAISAHVHVFEGTAPLAEYLAEDSLDLLVIDSWDYLTMEPIPNLPVAFAAVEQGEVEDEFLVLVAERSPMSGVSDLAGKHVIVLQSSNASTIRHWFRTEILALGQGEPERVLGRLELKDGLSQTVLPVFFGKADACVVDRRGFEIMVEMNPQVGRALRVLARSDPYVDTVLSVRMRGWEREGQRQDLLDAIQDLPNDPAGRQIMTLFKFDGVVPFEPHYLDSMRSLRRRYESLVSARGGGEGFQPASGQGGSRP